MTGLNIDQQFESITRSIRIPERRGWRALVTLLIVIGGALLYRFGRGAIGWSQLGLLEIDTLATCVVMSFLLVSDLFATRRVIEPIREWAISTLAWIFILWSVLMVGLEISAGIHAIVA